MFLKSLAEAAALFLGMIAFLGGGVGLVWCMVWLAETNRVYKWVKFLAVGAVVFLILLLIVWTSNVNPHRG